MKPKKHDRHPIDGNVKNGYPAIEYPFLYSLGILNEIQAPCIYTLFDIYKYMFYNGKIAISSDATKRDEIAFCLIMENKIMR